MNTEVSELRTALTPQRMCAAFIFLPLLSYAFPPFMDADVPYGLRLLFWVGVMAIALGAIWATRVLLRDKLILLKLPLRDLAFAAVILVFLTPLLWLLAWGLFTYTGKMVPEVKSVAAYGVLFATGLVLVRRGDLHADSMGGAKPPELPRLSKRLPEGFEGQIYRLTVRDHNVDVVTSEGVFSIRSRFTDAIAEMEPVPGHCSHRSHWVTDASIAGVEKTGSKTFLRLVNGDLVPVSRKYKPMLEEDGLI
ncbi:MAG: LytTR family DNA-binding domain-containing protein [Pseudomonadota bacterium]